MIEFPPEFFGMVEALWVTYQYSILIWMAIMLGFVLLLGFVIIAYNIIEPLWSYRR
jgi:hypothetical protein